MSRHEIPAKRADVIVSVGWDSPLQTYFAQVEQKDPSDEDEGILLWVGGSPKEIQTPEALAGALAAYADLSAETIAALRADFVADLDRAPTPLQRRRLGLP